jgi:hypothetical protein
LKIKTIRAYLILPVCLLILNAFEEVAVYKLQSMGLSAIPLTGILILMFAIGFALVGDLFAPRIQRLLEKGHRKSKRDGGWIGATLFYTFLVVAIFLVYYVIYTNDDGAKFLLPPSLR